MTAELERVADAIEAEWYAAGPPSPRRGYLDEWDGIVRGPAGFTFVCGVCGQAATVPHDTNDCGGRQ